MWTSHDPTPTGADMADGLGEAEGRVRLHGALFCSQHREWLPRQRVGWRGVGSTKIWLTPSPGSAAAGTQQLHGLLRCRSPLLPAPGGKEPTPMRHPSLRRRWWPICLGAC